MRGAWLHYCASDAEIETFVEKDLIAPQLAALIDAIEERPEFESKFLSKVKENSSDYKNGHSNCWEICIMWKSINQTQPMPGSST